MRRFRELGERVIAVNLLARGADFKKTFRTLVNDYRIDVEDAFYLATRVYRGSGFKEVYKFWKEGHDLRPFFRIPRQGNPVMRKDWE